MPMWLKRLLRPLIPDSLMARRRLAQHSRQVRTNVDLFVADEAMRRRWLAVTPDTYRVGTVLSSSSGLGDHSAVFGDEDHRTLARSARSATDADVGVVGTVSRPRLVGRRRTEPRVDPLTVAITPEMLDEVGPPPDGDLVALMSRVREAGGRLAVVPVDTADDVAPGRSDRLVGRVVLMLAAVPMHDIGGGSRTTQMALELVRRGFTVVYVTAYGSAESTDLGLRFVHPRLEQYRLDEFDAAATMDRSAQPGWVMVEAPLPRFGPVLDAARWSGWQVCYDVIDDWSDRSLGGDWFDAEFEKALLASADAVVVSAPDLVAGASRAGRTATVIPNAVHSGIFGGPDVAAPADLPVAQDGVIGYHGSLYGDWIDWGAIGRVARAHPDSAVVLIGDASKGHPNLPQNVHFLGLKAQSDLPAYVRRFAVGLVPFIVSPMTHAVSPLKVFEYMACGVAVAASPLRALEGLDGVYVADDLVDAVDRALAAPRPDAASALENHSWMRRIETLLGVLGMTPPAASTEVRMVTRPVVHYSEGDRRL